jgi:hypothetical protein
MHLARAFERRVSTTRYVPGNVRVVSWRANSLCKDATPEELQALAEHYSDKRTKPLQHGTI